MRSQADEIKKLKHALKETQSQVQAPPPPSSSQPDSLLSEQLETLRSELLEVRAQLVEQHHLIEQTQLQAEQARLFTSLRSSGGRSGWGLGSLFSSLGESLARLKPKRAPTLADLRAKTSGGPLPPPPVPVYDPFEESTSIEGLTTQKSDTQEEKPIQDPWEIKEELLHRPVVTNIPQPISDEETPTGLSNEEAKVSSTSTDENVSHSAESEALITSGKPFQSVMGSSPFPEHQVGGLTMSRFSQQGLDPQMTAIILQQTQVIKQLDFQVKQLTSRLNEQASSTKNQSEIIEQLIASSHRANDKVQNRVKKLERSRDISQQNSSGLKIHHKRISQLEMLIEGFEAKLAMFQEKLSAKDPTKQATDIRVSLDPDTGDFQSIQEAIDAAPVGAYIGVMPGIYQDPIEITKPVKIIGLGRPQDILIQVKEETALVLNRMGGGYEEAMSSQQEQEVRKRLQQYTGIEAPTMGSQVLKWVKRKLGQPVVADEGVFDDKTGTDEVSLASLTISSITTEVGGPPSERPAIIVRSGHLRLDNCAIRCENGHGIVLEGEGVELTLRASKIIQVRGSGIYLRTRAQATLAGSSIIKSKEVGIDAQGNTSLRLMDCDISNNQRTGIQVGFKSQLIIYNTVISGNHFEGIWMNNKSTGVIKGCDMRGNARGPYDISTDCHVEMSGNKP